MILATLTYPISISVVGELDWGPVISGYFRAVQDGLGDVGAGLHVMTSAGGLVKVDGITTTTDYSDGMLSIDHDPLFIWVTKPGASGDTANQQYTIRWLSNGPDDRSIDLYYDTDTIPSTGLEFENTFHERRRAMIALRRPGVSGIHLPAYWEYMYWPMSFMIWIPFTFG